MLLLFGFGFGLFVPSVLIFSLEAQNAKMLLEQQTGKFVERYLMDETAAVAAATAALAVASVPSWTELNPEEALSMVREKKQARVEV